jgi:uncharacterized protein YkwD
MVHRFKTSIHKRVAVILIIVVLLGMGAPGTYARTYDFELYANALNALGVFEGTPDGYELERPPTRLEGLILFVKLLGEQNEGQQFQINSAYFTDVPSWGRSYAEYAYYKGYTSGIGNRMLGADDELQARSYITFLLKALGYAPESGDFTWQTAIEDSARLGLIDSEDALMLQQDTFTRGHVAYLSYRALNTYVKDQDALLSDVLKNQKSDSESSSVQVLNQKAAFLSLYKENLESLEGVAYYEETPNLSAPYSAGRLNSQLADSAVKLLNLVRYAAKLPSDVALSTEWSDYAQHAALVSYVNDELSHYPNKPSDMTDAVYTKGATGAKTSNIYYGFNYVKPEEVRDTVLGYMDDSDPYNIGALGHRRWLLSTTLDKIGVGYVTDGSKTYSAIKVFDTTYKENTLDYDYIAWPSAGQFPIAFFGSHIAWSVHPNTQRYDNSRIDQIEVQLENVVTGHVEVFRQDEIRVVSDQSQKYFNIDVNGYGDPFAIIFRPDQMTLSDNQAYHVIITGLYAHDGTPHTIEYSTQFFTVD